MRDTVRVLGKLILVLLIFLILFSYAMFQGGFVSWFLFYGFLPIFIYLFGMLLYPIKNLHVSRELSHHKVRAGDTSNVVITLKRSFPFPLYFCICEEMFPESLNKVDNRTDKYQHMEDSGQLQAIRKIKKIVFAGFKREIKLNYQIAEIPRGEHQLFAIRFRTVDLFGFIKKEHVFKVFDNLVAFPNERELVLRGKVNNFEQGSMTAQSTAMSNTNIVSGIREYLPGDKFSSIDWKQTARKNTVMTKEFEQERSTDMLLILDGCKSENLNILAFEAVVELSLSLVETIQKQSQQVGFLSIGEKSVYFPLRHDPAKKELIRQHLTQIQPSGKQFAVKLQEEGKRLSSGYTAIIITTDMNEAFKQSIQQIRKRIKRIIVCFVASSQMITEQQQQFMQQLRFTGVIINVITEKQLVQNRIEVRVV